MSSHKGTIALLSLDTSHLIETSVESALDKIKNHLKNRFNLGPETSIPITDGSMIVLTSSPNSFNPSLTATLRYYSEYKLINTNLEGCGPLNIIGGNCADTDELRGLDSDGLNNTCLDALRMELRKLLSVDIEKIPLIKRGSSVANYFTSSDDRVFEYDFDELLFDKMSDFQEVRIYHSPTLGNALFLDGLQNLAEGDIAYTHGLMKKGEISYEGKEIFILGGGDGGLLAELLKENPKWVTMVDIDAVVMESCKKHLRGACGNVLDTFSGDNYEIIVGDCIKYLEKYIEEEKKFDYIHNDLTDIPLSSEKTQVGRDLWAFIRNVLNLSLKCLKPNGKYLNHAIGSGCTNALQAYENILKSLPTKVDFQSHVAYVPSFYENWVFYEIWNVQ